MMSILDPSGLEAVFGFQDVKPGEKQQKVDDVFHKVAERYDMMNDVMSAGMHRIWKDALVSMLALPRNWECDVLDMAGGTGDIAFKMARKAKRARITVCDINKSMLEVGAKRAEQLKLSQQIEFVSANAEHLPFKKNCFDAYTIGFGIRNVPKLTQALSEAYRVLKRGGRFLCLEFSSVNTPIFDALYEAYSFNVIPLLGQWLAQDRESYQYLVESIRTFPNQDCFAQLIREAGFQRVTYRNFTAGVVAVHSGWKL